MPAAPAGQAKVSHGNTCLHLKPILNAYIFEQKSIYKVSRNSFVHALSLSMMLPLQTEDVRQGSTVQPTPAPVKKEEIAAEPDSSAGAAKQEDQDCNTGASSSGSKKHAGTEVRKEQEDKQDEFGSKRLSGGSPQKTPTKKLKETAGSMESSPVAKQKKGPMDSFVIKNPA